MFDRMVPAEDGHFINEKFAYINEIIQDFDSRLQLVWIPPENRVQNDTEPPYAVMHTAPDGQQKIVLTIKEEELDQRVLQKLFLGDTSRNDVLAQLEAAELATEVMRNKELMEKAEFRKDFVATVVGSHKHSFRHNGKVIPT